MLIIIAISPRTLQTINRKLRPREVYQAILYNITVYNIYNILVTASAATMAISVIFRIFIPNKRFIDINNLHSYSCSPSVTYSISTQLLPFLTCFYRF